MRRQEDRFSRNEAHKAQMREPRIAGELCAFAEPKAPRASDVASSTRLIFNQHGRAGSPSMAQPTSWRVLDRSVCQANDQVPDTDCAVHAHLHRPQQTQTCDAEDGSSQRFDLGDVSPFAAATATSEGRDTRSFMSLLGSGRGQWTSGAPPAL